MRTLFTFILICYGSLFAQIQSVVFDCGGVVVNLDRDRLITFVSEKFRVSQEDALDLLHQYKDAWQNGMDEETFWQKIADELHQELPQNWHHDFECVKLDAVKINEDIIQLVKSLQAKGYQTPMLSNANEFQAEHLKKTGVYSFFSPLLLSYQMGVEKPDPKAYEILLKVLQVEPRCVLFIDDKLENSVAAEKCGIDVIQFKSVVQLKDELEKKNL